MTRPPDDARVHPRRRHSDTTIMRRRLVVACLLGAAACGRQPDAAMTAFKSPSLWKDVRENPQYWRVLLGTGGSW